MDVKKWICVIFIVLINSTAFGEAFYTVPDDYTTIQAAIDALPIEGGTVYVKANTYVLTNFVHINKSNVTLTGESGTILKMDDYIRHPVLLIGHPTDPLSNRIANIRISNIELDGNKANHATNANDDPNFEIDATYGDVKNQCLEARGVDDLWINNIEAHDAVSGGVVLCWGCNRVYIDSSSIYNNNFDGVSINGSQNIMVSNFIAYNNNAAGLTMDAENNKLQFSNGLIYANGSVGIFCRWTNNVTFRGLDIYDNPQGGILASYNLDEFNAGNTSLDIGVDGMYIQGCFIHNNGSDGVKFYPEPNTSTNLSENNFISGCAFKENNGAPIYESLEGELIRTLNLYGKSTYSNFDDIVYSGIRLRNWDDKIVWGTADNNQYMTENYGIEIHGSEQCPPQIRDASLLIGYDQSDDTSRGTGNLFVQGNIGVGTLSASAKLDVAGDIMALGYVDASGDPLLRSSDNSIQVTEDTDGSWNITNSAPSLWQTGTDSNIYRTSGNVGIGTTTPTKTLDVTGDINVSGAIYQNGVLFDSHSVWDNDSNGNIFYTSGNVGIGTSTPAYQLDIVNPNNSSQQLFFNSNKAAFRAGDGNGRWIDTSVGNYSFAGGYYTEASGNYSTALGINAQATNTGAIAIGQSCDATGPNSLALGYTNLASGNLSCAIGAGSSASGAQAIAIRGNSSGESAIAVGGGSSSGDYSHTFGRSIEAQARNSMVIGNGGDVAADYSQHKIINTIPDSLMIGFNSDTPTMFVNSNSVGIGTTSPRDRLEVAGNIRFNDWTNKLQWNTSDGNQYLTEGWGVEIHGAATHPTQIRDTSLLVGYDQTDGSDRGIGNLLVQGNVGIGTITPAHKLEVAGDVILENSSTPSIATGHAGIYANNGELFSVDEMGNSTQISPHDKETGEWVFFSKNLKTGRVIRINMEKLVKKVEELTGEKFSEEWVE